MPKFQLTAFDRFTLAFAPRWTIQRVQARAALEVMANGVSKRHYEAAQPGRRTSGWPTNFMDADLNIRGANIHLRNHARDLIRNNSWARRGQEVIANNTVGWGISAKPAGADSGMNAKALELWNAWAGTSECDSEGRQNFYGFQTLAMLSIVESGEVLFRRRWRKAKDNLTLPFQLQILEADYLDHARNTLDSLAGGPTIQGIEFDKLGRRAAYWLFEKHPGSGRNSDPSRRVPAEDVIHVYRIDRPGQSRGASWFGSVIVNMKDFDEYEDATLMRQKIAACFAGFVTDLDGTGLPLGTPGQPDGTTDSTVETFEPGMIERLPAGKDIKFGNPPAVVEDGFSVRTLRKAAAGLGVTYEDMTGDYSQVNFSSARMARLSHWANVNRWRWTMLIPQLCDGIWNWAMEGAQRYRELPDDVDPPSAKWTPPPMPLIEPDKEAKAIQLQVRGGMMTHDEMVREQGYDPDAHWQEYADGLKRLDKLGIVLDSDPRKTTAVGQEQPNQAPEPDAKQIPDSKQI